MGKLTATLKRVIQTLNSQEFQEHIQQTLGMPPYVYQSLITKLIVHVRAGDRDKWCGILIYPAEFRIGYSGDGTCYTQIIRDGAVRSYDFASVKSS